MDQSGRHQSSLGPALGMSRHYQGPYNSMGKAGVMQSLWMHQVTAGENSGTWERPETEKVWCKSHTAVSRQRKDSVLETERWDMNV